MKHSYKENQSPLRGCAATCRHARNAASLIVLIASLALVGCSDPDDPEQPTETDAANHDEDTSSDEGETYPTIKECLAATTVEECEQAGCYVLNSFGVDFQEFTEADGCREGGDELLCSPHSGGDASTGFFWRERADGVVVTWSFPSVVWPTQQSDRWKQCTGFDPPSHPACACNERWVEDQGGP